MAQCVVCSEDVDVSTAKRFGCCPALYCEACHEETLEGGTCGECFADLSAAFAHMGSASAQVDASLAHLIAGLVHLVASSAHLVAGFAQ